MLLLSPKGRPVPSVLILSSTKAMAGPAAAVLTAAAAAINDAAMLLFELMATLKAAGVFSSTVHFTRPFVAIASTGSPAGQNTDMQKRKHETDKFDVK